jgi:hypothetical protein
MTNYQLALAENRSSPFGKLEPIVAFTTNAAGAQIVDTLGPLRQIVAGPAQQSGQGSAQQSGQGPAQQSGQESDRQYLVIIPASASGNSEPLQVQLE